MSAKRGRRKTVFKMNKLYVFFTMTFFAVSIFVSCSKESTDSNTNGSTNGNNSTTGSIIVKNNNKGQGSIGNITSLYVLNPSNEKVIASGGAIYKGESKTISNIDEGTYSVQAYVMRNGDLVAGTKNDTKTGIRVNKGKTTTVTFQ